MINWQKWSKTTFSELCKLIKRKGKPECEKIFVVHVFDNDSYQKLKNKTKS